MLHMFNLGQLSEFHQYLENITKAGYKYDMYVALPTGCDARVITSRWPKAVVIHHNDRGMDLGGFFALCPSLMRHRYDYVLKLHTKSEKQWRTDLVIPLIGTPGNVMTCLKSFDIPTIGMVGARKWLINMSKDFGIYTPHLTAICKTWKICNNKYTFIGGTMFWIRYNLLRNALAHVSIPVIIQSLNTDETLDWHWYLIHYDDLRRAGIDTEAKALEHWNTVGKHEGRACNVLYGRRHGIPIRIDGMIEHSYERFFGLLVAQAGQVVIGV